MASLTKLVVCAFTFAVVINAGAASKPEKNDDAKMNAFISKLMAKMTLQEKAGQLNQLVAEMATTGSHIKWNYREEIKKGNVGSIFNSYGPEIKELQKLAVENTRLKIPLIFGHDVIHGHRTIFPIPLGESSSWDLPMMEKSARLAGKEASADGLHWTFAPMVDISRDPRWGRVMEGAGEDTWLAKKIGEVRVRGFQGSGPRETDNVYACVKHFAAYGAPVAGRDYNTVDMSERELYENYLPPYEAAVKAGAATVMTSFNEISGVPSTSNSWLLTKLLRDDWKFKGLVVTDYGAVGELQYHGVAGDMKDAARLAINAGADMDMMSDSYSEHLVELVKSGKVKMSTVDKSVRLVLEAKYRRGLFDDPYRFSNDERAKATIGSKEMMDHARDMARKSIVLLKNDKDVLPLKREGTIALIGPMAENKLDQIGAWASAGDWKQSVSLMEGMLAGTQGKVKVITSPGSNVLEDGEMKSYLNKHGAGIQKSPRPLAAMMDDAVRTAKKADVVVMALGEAASMSGEAASRTKIRLPDSQLALLKRVKEQVKKPIVLLVYSGRPLALEDEVPMVDAVVQVWFLGTQAGNAIADVLYGDYNPSGRLTQTFPRNEGQIPIYYNAKNTGRPDDPNEKYRSKYIDTSIEPLYPFGYGLSYTKFEYSEPRLSDKKMKPTQKMKVAVTVKNAGERDGEETVQLYVRDMVSSVTRPVKMLRGFQKVFLKKGESREVAMELGIEDLKFYNGAMKWVYEPGDFKVMVGPNSRDTKEAMFTLTDGKDAAGDKLVSVR